VNNSPELFGANKLCIKTTVCLVYHEEIMELQLCLLSTLEFEIFVKCFVTLCYIIFKYRLHFCRNFSRTSECPPDVNIEIL